MVLETEVFVSSVLYLLIFVVRIAERRAQDAQRGEARRDSSAGDEVSRAPRRDCEGLRRLPFESRRFIQVEWRLCWSCSAIVSLETLCYEITDFILGKRNL